MVSPQSKSVIELAKRLYAEQLRHILEPLHVDKFVAIEPESGEYFLADTFDEAVELSEAKYPSRLSYVMRVGHPAALFFGDLWLIPRSRLK